MAANLDLAFACQKYVFTLGAFQKSAVILYNKPLLDRIRCSGRADLTRMPARTMLLEAAGVFVSGAFILDHISRMNWGVKPNAISDH